MADAFSHKGLIIEVDHSVPRLAVDGREVPKEKLNGVFDPAEASESKALKLRKFAEKFIEDSSEFKKREAIKQAQLAVLAQGVAAWNKWREENPEIRPLLYDADLGSNTFPAGLRQANFANANLIDAKLIGTDLEGANFHEANLKGAKLINANLTGVNFCRADLYETNLSGASLINANLQGAQLAKTVFRGAHIIGCKVYGMSAWDLDLTDAEQRDLIVRYRHKIKSEPGAEDNEDEITIFDLRVAQFIYLLLNKENIRDALDTINAKTVLILGRFTPERFCILDALRDELRKRNNLVPIVFDFEKPQSRNLTETISTLAHISRFVIADLTDPRSVPVELMAIAPSLQVPIQTIILDSQDPYALFGDLRSKCPWVLKPHRYTQVEDLLQSLAAKVIEPAVAKAKEIGELRKDDDA